ncbi:hypothetical protein RSAG8_13123, partial [Rhizoctonia solani AG-8 WAC10335]
MAHFERTKPRSTTHLFISYNAPTIRPHTLRGANKSYSSAKTGTPVIVPPTGLFHRTCFL